MIEAVMDQEKLREKIFKLKTKKNAVILAHNYQVPAIQEVADYLGDSLELSKISKELQNDVIVFCGVLFMAETAKILSPQKKVFLPVIDAGCPLADMITAQQLLDLKKQYPQAWVVSYVNSSAEIKALSDVCCTSANAVSVVRNIPAQTVIFVPDKNLGWWVQHNVPEKKIISWKGYCYVHEQFIGRDVDIARQQHPDAEIVVHPECRQEVLLKADYVASTSGMVRRAQQSAASILVIGTEQGMINRLQRENPNKTFYSLGIVRTCINMKKTSLLELYQALEYEQFSIELPAEIIEKSHQALTKMVQFV